MIPAKWPDAEELYPLVFQPICKERIWGGTLLREVLGRELPQTETPIGESWEVSDRPEANSVVRSGALAGCTLHELLAHYGTALVGGKTAPERFPLLVKLIDAGERLSLQVHPDEIACRSIGGGAEPKTEMWYIIAARRGACILAGLDPRATLVQTKSLLNSPEIEQVLRKHPSVPGDGYFIPAGTLHAIGAGNLILEIQQNSDTTYRLSDWGRVDAQGKPRELHVEKGLASVHFTDRSNPRIAGGLGYRAAQPEVPAGQAVPVFFGGRPAAGGRVARHDGAGSGIPSPELHRVAGDGASRFRCGGGTEGGGDGAGAVRLRGVPHRTGGGRRLGGSDPDVGLTLDFWRKRDIFDGVPL